MEVKEGKRGWGEGGRKEKEMERNEQKWRWNLREVRVKLSSKTSGTGL